MSPIQPQDYLERVSAIAPIIAAEAGNIERTRRLTPPTVQALIDGGFYRMLQPRWLGGAELSPAAFSDVIEALAKIDASTAWCLAQCSACAMAAAYLDKATAAEIFKPSDGIIAWGPPAPSKAIKVDGGYRVTGAWNFASGGHQASWIGGQSYLFDSAGQQITTAQGAPTIRMMVFPRGNLKIVDVWDVMGMCGTGSDSYRADDVFVPERFSFARDDAAERKDSGMLFKLSTSNIYSFGFGSVALGIARQMLDDAIALASEKTPGGSKRALRDNNVIQSQIGRCEAAWRSARSYLHSTARDLWQSLATEATPTLEQKIEIRLASTWTIHRSAEIVDTVYHMLGSTAVFRKNTFERRFRDMHTVTQQIQGRQSNYENVGQVMLGLEPDAALFTT
jgi:indole-3-acetate monooxygenase